MQPLPEKFSKITIYHNHGLLILSDAVIFDDKYGFRNVKGIVVGGGVQDRLFHATSYTKFPVGKEETWCIGSSRPIQDSSSGNWIVDATFC